MVHSILHMYNNIYIYIITYIYNNIYIYIYIIDIFICTESLESPSVNHFSVPSLETLGSSKFHHSRLTCPRLWLGTFLLFLLDQPAGGVVVGAPCFPKKKSPICVFPKIGGYPKMDGLMENPIKMDDLGVPLFSETSNMCFLVGGWGFQPIWQNYLVKNFFLSPGI